MIAQFHPCADCEVRFASLTLPDILSGSTANLHMPREFFLTIGLPVGAASCATIPRFALLADRFGRRRVYIIGGHRFAEPCRVSTGYRRISPG